MDYECDVGYVKTDQGTCQKDASIEPEELKGGLTEDQIAQCDHYGYYTVTQGYRKIPGDRCVGGLDLNPTVYSCSYSGMILGFLSLKSFLSLIIMGAIFYFGWPFIEALLIILPIPDPKEYKDKLMGLFTRTEKKTTTGSHRELKNRKPQGKAEGYAEGFSEAPQSLEEEEDDDEEDDVGRPINLKDKKNLNYDSDEEKHTQGELI